MVRSISCINVVISNPSDMNLFRSSIEAAIDEYNSIFGYNQGVHFRAIHWAKNITGQAVNDGQLAINEQLLEDYDLLIAVIGGRLGSSTPRAISGTVEEIILALNKKDEIFGGHHIQILFQSRVTIDPSSVDFSQLEKIQSFKREVQNKALTIDFTDEKEINEKVMRFLEQASTRVLRWKEGLKGDTNIVKAVIEEDIHAHLEIENNEDFGIYDELELASTSFNEVAELVGTFGQILTSATSEMNEVISKHGGTGEFHNDKIMFDKVGIILEQRAEDLAPLVNRFSLVSKQGSDHFDNALLMIDTMEETETEFLRKTIIETIDSLRSFLNAMVGANLTLGNLPRSTRKFNIGRRRFIAETDGFFSSVDESVRRFSEYVSYLDNS